MTDLQDLYKSNFDSTKYLTTYTSPYNENMFFAYSTLHNFFNSDIIKGSTLIEVGCGPTISSVISASRTIKDITLSDLLEQNRNEVLKWKNKEDGAFDWTPVFKYFGQLENETDYTKLEARVRDSVGSVLPINILSDNPIVFTKRTFDVAVSTFMLENVAKDLDGIVTALKNFNRLLNSKGYLLLIGGCNGTYYILNDTEFPSVKLNKSILEKCLVEAGFKILEWRLKERTKPSASLSDYNGTYGLVAQKIN